jgi:hypothetical protein
MFSFLEFAGPQEGFRPGRFDLEVTNGNAGAIARGEVVKMELDNSALEFESGPGTAFSTIEKTDVSAGDRNGFIYAVALEAIAAGAKGKVRLYGLVEALAASINIAADSALGLAEDGLLAGAGNVADAGTAPVIARSKDAVTSGSLGLVWFNGVTGFPGTVTYT